MTMHSLKGLAAAALLAFSAGLCAAGTITTAQAGEGPVAVKEAWARATIPNRPGAAYLTIHNGGEADDRLVAASSPAAGRVELHTHIMDGDVMKMRPVEAIAAPAGAMAVLQPGGDHIMLFELAEPLKEGGHIKLTLTFEKAGDIEVMAQVQAMGAQGTSGGMSHGEHGSGMQHEGQSQ